MAIPRRVCTSSERCRRPTPAGSGQVSTLNQGKGGWCNASRGGDALPAGALVSFRCEFGHLADGELLARHYPYRPDPGRGKAPTAARRARRARAPGMRTWRSWRFRRSAEERERGRAAKKAVKAKVQIGRAPV